MAKDVKNVLGVRVDDKTVKVLRTEAEKNRRNIGQELAALIEDGMARRRDRAALMERAEREMAAPQMVTGLPAKPRAQARR
jgi:hypothetical protein